MHVFDLFQSFRLQSPQSSGGLQVFGLNVETPRNLHYSTLDEALTNHELEVTEVSEGGSVPTLKVTNKSDRRVFLMAGEHLVGAKQNRVLNTSIMIEKHSAVPIPVSCVEQGRWSYRSPGFVSGGTTSHSVLRQKMTKSVTESYLACSAPMSDQGEVWGEVSRKLDSMGSISGSAAMEQVYEDHSSKLEGYTNQLHVPEGCNGAVFVLNGQVVGMDLFDQSETLRKLWPKLIKGYAIDALEHSSTNPTYLSTEDVEKWVKQTTQTEPKAFPSPGIGEDIRLKGKDRSGASLMVESEPVHTQLFAERI
jgi:hypothetical protein